MEPLSGAASVLSVLSLAIQVAESVKKLQDFFQALDNAPREIRRIQKTLGVISTVLKQLQDDLDDENDDDLTLRQALVDCRGRIQEVYSSVQDLAPAFMSEGRAYRAWSAFKTVKRSKLIERLEVQLEQAKSTLTLALQSSTRRLQVAHHESQRLALAQVFHSSRLNDQPDTKVVESSLLDHSTACRDEIATFTSTLSPWLRPHLEKALQECLEQTLDPLRRQAEEQTLRAPAFEVRGVEKHVMRARNMRSVAFNYIGRETPFGTIRFQSQLLAESYVTTTNDEETAPEAFVAKSRFNFVPSPWLRTFGLSYAIDFNLVKSSSGWKVALNMPRVVPDASAIFQLCKVGDVDGVRQLLLQDQASVFDVDSWGSTPLHVAAGYHHPALCQLLISNNADVHARDWAGWNQSPFGRACCEPQERLLYADESTTEPRQIQTFRKLLAAGFDIEDREADEQILRIASFDNGHALQRYGPSPRFDFPSQWILKQMLSTVLENPLQYDWLFWQARLRESLHSPGDNPSPEILPYCTPEAVRVTLVNWARILDFEKIWKPGPDGSLKDLKGMLEKVGHLHFAIDHIPWREHRPKLKTPTRGAMEHSRGFRNFVTLLRELEIDLHDFANAEAPLMDDGWSAEALLVLLEEDYQCPDTRPGEIKCKHCTAASTHLHSFWEPLWEQRKDGIKAGLQPGGPFTEEEMEVQARWRKYARIFYSEHMCYHCQERYEKEGLGSTELESHPGLIEIDA